MLNGMCTIEMIENLKIENLTKMWVCAISPYERRYMQSFIAKRVNSILVNLRYFRFKLLKYKENNKKICNTFDQNFKNIPLYNNEKGIIRKVLFCIIPWCPYFKNFKHGT